MPYLEQGPLEDGGYYREFSDGEGGAIRIEYRVDPSEPSVEIWAGRPDDLELLLDTSASF